MKQILHEDWTRLEFEQLPIYFYRHGADWFVPDPTADRLLQGLAENPLQLARLQARLPRPKPARYTGHPPERAKRLQAFWLHLSNRCNLSCRHCLFSCSPQAPTGLSRDLIQPLARQARDLGCRLFALTGGEPLLHPQFDQIAADLLADGDSELAILSNGLLLQQKLATQPLPAGRVHFQISLDGLPAAHDSLRGSGSFARLAENLAWLRQQGYSFSLAVCLHPVNIAELSQLVELSAQLGAGHLHLLWPFAVGRAAALQPPELETLFQALTNAALKAEQLGLAIDNLETLKTQVFAPKGTVHDGSAGGRESLALGPDGLLYPSAALVGKAELAMDPAPGLAAALTSPVARRIAAGSVLQLDQPLRFLLGGGDQDHSYHHDGTLLGSDPYQPLLSRLACWLIARAVADLPPAQSAPQNHDDRQNQPDQLNRLGLPEQPGLRLEMGEIVHSCGAESGVALVHPNCLLATAGKDSLRLVKEFYQQAAAEDNLEILNPASYPEPLLAHIPPAFRFRGYGCGSPILEADPQPGEAMLDLGSGRGVECLLAAKLVGPEGRVKGIDMLPAMLAVARQGAAAVAANLGYDNLSFAQGYLETLPEAANRYDLVTSNCVLNLSPHKRRVFAEILRVLKPGGRLVVADVVCEEEPGGAIRNDSKLSGECIGGALSQRHLLGLLAESGFTDITLRRRFPYRTVAGHPFYSLTFAAYKPDQPVPQAEMVRVDRPEVPAGLQSAVRNSRTNEPEPAAPAAPLREMIYRGPAAALLLDDGRLLLRGERQALPARLAAGLGEQVLQLDAIGAVLNQQGSGCCGSEPAPAPGGCDCGPAALPGILPITSVPIGHPGPTTAARSLAECMVCGEKLLYGERDQTFTCHYCGQTRQSRVSCRQQHFVCDQCHAAEALTVIEQICRESRETDMIALFGRIRRHPAIPKHGPEHHALIPAIIVTTYGNLGGALPPAALQTALERGSKLPGGTCGYWGLCGAAAGAGIGFATILEAAPSKALARQAAQRATQAVLAAISDYAAARCCYRESWTALTTAARCSPTLLPRPLLATAPLRCDQQAYNRFCHGKQCPLFP